MKILLAVDGSSYTERAVEFLIGHLAWFRDLPEIHVINVQPPIPSGQVQVFVGKDLIRQYHDEESELALARAREMLQHAKIPHGVVKKVGHIGQTISEYAVHHGFSLIVMGSHGHSALANLALGSVATRVIATSKIPVLLAR